MRPMVLFFSSLSLLVCVLFSSVTLASPSVAAASDFVPERTGLLGVDKPEFQSSRGKQFSIPFELSQPGLVTIEIYTPDGDLVRTLKAAEALPAARHELVWDGKDSEGMVVADEAYIPVFKVKTTEGKTVVDDSRLYSGGEILEDIRYQFRGKSEISYFLTAPARVLIRAGVRSGPMMYAMAHWEPRSPGKVVQRWDGYDEDKVEYFAEHQRAWVLVMAYKLPKYAIITSGNKKLSYRDYRKQRGWGVKSVDLNKIKLHRDGKPLEREYFFPRSFLPRLSFGIKDKLPISRHKLPVISDSVNFEITIPKEDRWILEASMYEVSLYIDYEFQSEEEQGFMPMLWRWEPKDLKPGRHIATVVVTGYGGYVVAKTLAFESK